MVKRLNSSKRWQICLRCLQSDKKDGSLYHIAKKEYEAGHLWSNPMDIANYCRIHRFDDMKQDGLDLCVPCNYRMEHAVLGQINGDTSIKKQK